MQGTINGILPHTDGNHGIWPGLIRLSDAGDFQGYAKRLEEDPRIVVSWDFRDPFKGLS